MMRAAGVVAMLVGSGILAACGNPGPPGRTTTTVSPSSTSPATSTSAVPTTTTTSASTRARPLAGIAVGLDPGHNGNNWSNPAYIDRTIWNGRGKESCDTTGTATNAGYPEAQFNWNVAV